MVFSKVCSTADMIIVPIGDPSAIMGRPSFSTISGVIEESGRLPGATALASAPTASQRFGVALSIEKSSISLFSTMPVPGTVIFEPNSVLMVCVIATALPALSSTLICVVPASSGGASRVSMTRGWPSSRRRPASSSA
jgi:hypothetical protein